MLATALDGTSQQVSINQANNSCFVQQSKEISVTNATEKISICQDETFHPEICLVAVEPVSNYIVLEEYSEKRDAESWTKAMSLALQDLPVEVIQATSNDLFKYLLDSLDILARPAKARRVAKMAA